MFVYVSESSRTSYYQTNCESLSLANSKVKLLLLHQFITNDIFALLFQRIFRTYYIVFHSLWNANYWIDPLNIEHAFYPKEWPRIERSDMTSPKLDKYRETGSLRKMNAFTVVHKHLDFHFSCSLSVELHDQGLEELSPYVSFIMCINLTFL
jgi:hypothetical protein